MPIGEFIGEFVFRGILEILFYGLTYYTGAVVLCIFTFDRVKIAPLSTIYTINKLKNRWTDWSIWLHRPLQKKVLKAEYVCLVGIVVLFTVGVWLYFVFGENKDKGGDPIPVTQAGVVTPMG